MTFVILFFTMNLSSVSAATLDSVLEPSGDSYVFTVDGSKLFSVDNGISGQVYPNSIRFHNDTNSSVNLQLLHVKELTDDTWLYRNSYIRIYDGKGVYYDGKLNGASLDVDLPEDWEEEIHFDYHYKDPNGRVPDNVAMGRTMNCRFTFQVTELGNLSSGWSDTGDVVRLFWLLIVAAIVGLWIWSRKKKKNAQISESENKNCEDIAASETGAKRTTMDHTQKIKNEKKKRTFSVKEVFLNILICLLAVIAATAIFIRVRFDPHYVETGSMRPEYAIGALVLVDDKAYANANPEVGDVAVYRTGSREIMHRVKEVTADGRYIFQGDNNNSEDFTPINKSAIVGKAVWHTNLIAPIVRQIKHLNNV